MKKLLCIVFIPIIILVFCGAAAGSRDKDIDDKDYDGKKVFVKYNKAKKVKIKESTDTHGYCIEAYALWCQQKCNNASPATPSSSDSARWGDNCTPGKLRKCKECGYIINND